MEDVCLMIGHCLLSLKPEQAGWLVASSQLLVEKEECPAELLLGYLLPLMKDFTPSLFAITDDILGSVIPSVSDTV